MMIFLNLRTGYFNEEIKEEDIKDEKDEDEKDDRRAAGNF